MQASGGVSAWPSSCDWLLCGVGILRAPHVGTPSVLPWGPSDGKRLHACSGPAWALTPSWPERARLSPQGAPAALRDQGPVSLVLP